MTPESIEGALLAALDATERHVAAIAAVQDALSEGWLNLARARYSLGPLRVGQLQWNEAEIGAQSVVDVLPDKFRSLQPAESQLADSDTSTGMEIQSHVQHDNGSGHLFVLCSPQSNLVGRLLEKSSTESGRTGQVAEIQELRQRRPGLAEKDKSAQRDGSQSDASTSDMDGSQTACADDSWQESAGNIRSNGIINEIGGVVRPGLGKDPIRWFSAMPPPALRKAQKDFRAALENLVELANAQREAAIAQDKYIAMLEKTRS